MRHECKSPASSYAHDGGYMTNGRLDNRSQVSVIPSDRHTIAIKFPLGKFARFFANAEDHPDVLARFPDAKAKALTLLDIHLDTAEVTVDGFGRPFANAGDVEVEGWVNDGKPILGNHTLVDLLQAKDFFVVVAFNAKDTEKEWDEARMPPSFAYPNGNKHSFQVNRMKKLLQDNKGGQFLPAYG